jgi:hypothetical protein
MLLLLHPSEVERFLFDTRGDDPAQGTPSIRAAAANRRRARALPASPDPCAAARPRCFAGSNSPGCEILHHTLTPIQCSLQEPI